MAQDWSALIQGVAQWKGKKAKTWMKKISLGAAVYGIWKERNARIFKQESRPKEIVLQDILCLVKYLIKANWKNNPNIETYVS